VWWDRKIPPGKTFDEVIEEALDDSKAVLAVWTEASATSRWVRTEAAEGAARSVLVPVLMDDVQVPLAFRRIQAADLRDWEPGVDHAGFDELIEALAAIIGSEEPEETHPMELALIASRGRAAEADWAGVITILSPFADENADFAADQPEAAELLSLARRNQQALALYEEAEVLYTDARWVDVVTRFDQILELDPEFAYGTDLKDKAEQHITQEEELRLAALYDRAATALEAREWPVAVALFTQLAADAPDYRDSEMQLELARAGAESDRRYRELQQELRDGDPALVIAGLTELAETNPEFGDPEDLMGQANALVEAAEPTPAVAVAAVDAATDAVQPRPEPKPTPEPTWEPDPARSATGGGPKWWWIAAGVAAVAIVAVVLVAALGGGGEGGADAAAAPPTTSADGADDAAGGVTTTAQDDGAVAAPTGQLVCLVADVAGTGDMGYNASAWEGAQRAAEDIGAEARLLESATDEDYGPNIREFIDQGCDVIVTVGWRMGGVTLEAAEAAPDTSFAIVDIGYEAPPPNLRGLVFAADQAAFMAGYTAAAMSESGRVGTFGGMDIPSVTVFMDGYVRGVEFYNTEKARLGDQMSGNQPRVEVLGWNPEANEGLFIGNFENLDDGWAVAQDLVDQGADIIMPVAGPVTYGAAALATELGTFMVVGVDVDMALTDPEHADVYLTSVTKEVHNAVYQAVADALAGNHTNEPFVGELYNEGVGIAPNRFERIVPDDTKIELEAIRQLISEGVIATNG
jgi:basic membrane protein A